MLRFCNYMFISKYAKKKTQILTVRNLDFVTSYTHTKVKKICRVFVVSLSFL